MMTLSKALAAGQAKDYFEAEYTSTQESYYSEADTVKGKWFGRQAEAWELQGEVNPEHFSREYLAASSPRSAEIQREAAEIKQRLAQQGIQIEDGAGLRQAAAKTDRMNKHYDRLEMRARHLDMDAQFGGTASHRVQVAQEQGPIVTDEHEVNSRAREAVTFARESASEREAVVDQRQVVVDALRRNLGFTTYDAVMDELNRRIESGEFISVSRTGAIAELTTSQTVAMEQSNIRTIVAGKGTQIAICGAQPIGPLLDEITAKQGINLNQSQRKAVERILETPDRIVGLEGRAGTGKTTTLSVLRETAERYGYAVQGFAPTGAAADLLSESGIRTCTLQKFVSGNQIYSDPEQKICTYLMNPRSRIPGTCSSCLIRLVFPRAYSWLATRGNTRP